MPAGVKKAALVSRSRESHSASSNMYMNLRAKGPFISESAVELQCDEIQGKLTSFISSLKDAQDSILQSEQNLPLEVKEWCTAQSPNMTSAAQPTQEYEREKTGVVLRSVTTLLLGTGSSWMAWELKGRVNSMGE